MIDPPLYCAIPGCDFTSARGSANLEQLAQLQAHFSTHLPNRSGAAVKENLGKGHDGLPGHPGPVSPSIVEQVWARLDHYIDVALDWPQVSTGPWDSETDEIAYLKDQLERAKASAAGRGLAIALSLMQYSAYADDNAVMDEALRRREARQQGGAVPADEAQQVTQPDPTPAAPAVSPAPPVAPAPQASPDPALGEHEIARIREALAQGFDADGLASMFGISTEEIAALATSHG